MKREQLVAISIITTRFVELEGDVGEVMVLSRLAGFMILELISSSILLKIIGLL